MLIEQAFYNLPEILVGSGYARQEYEAGIVSALSLAVLQELNGRNAQNPISFLQVERRFSDDFPKLRADLFVRLDRLYVGSRGYSDFGFRHNNWIEAKFFRLGKGTPPSTQNLGSVVADLVRLVALVPIETAKKQENQPDLLTNGRYFLHAYRGDPLKHLNPKRKKAGAAEREWVKCLLTEGQQTIADFELDQETDTFFTPLGKPLKEAKLEMTISNIKIEPTQTPGYEYYTLVLTRIDAAKITFDGNTFSFKADRTFASAPAESFENMRKAVAKALKSDAVDDPIPTLDAFFA